MFLYVFFKYVPYLIWTLYNNLYSLWQFYCLSNGFPVAPGVFLNTLLRLKCKIVMFAGCVPLSALWVPVAVVPHPAAPRHATVPLQGQQAVWAAHLHVWCTQLCPHDRTFPRPWWKVLLTPHPVTRRVFWPQQQDG